MTTAKQNEYGPQDCIKRLREEADDIITEEGSRRIARLMQRSAAAIQELLNENDALRERFVADHSADMLGMVDATDHPDYIGGIVWSDCELRYINQRLTDAAAIIATLHIEFAERKRDAARYHWLKENKSHSNTHCWHFSHGPIIPALLSLDASIDAAMKEKE